MSRIMVGDFTYEGIISIQINGDGDMNLTIQTNSNHTRQAFPAGRDLALQWLDLNGVWTATCILYETRPTVLRTWAIHLWVKDWDYIKNRKEV